MGARPKSLAPNLANRAAAAVVINPTGTGKQAVPTHSPRPTNDNYDNYEEG